MPRWPSPLPAQAVLVAALANFTERSPIVVVTATGVDADRLADDLSCLLPRRDGEGAPETATVAGRCGGSGRGVAGMGDAALRTGQSRSRDDGPPSGAALGPPHPVDDPMFVAAPGDRGADPRPAADDSGPRRPDAPTTVRPGQELSADELLSRLVGAGYRREHQVEHRGEIAVRGGIIDVFPSTADVPVRIDLWGDEVDRLTAFAVNDQRSQTDLDAAVFFGCRELVPTADVRAAAASLVRSQPWGSRPVGTAGRGRDLRRHGVLAALRPPPGRPPAGPPPSGLPGGTRRAPADP